MEKYLPLLPFAMFGLIFLVIIIVVVFSTQKEKQRRESLKSWASELGMSYQEKDETAALLNEYLGFKTFSKGRSKKIFNILERGDPDTFLTRVFDYRYTVGSGKNSSTHTQTIIAFRSGRFNFPQFFLRPEHFIDTVAKTFGHDDIDFTENELFSKKYFLKGADEEEIRKIFTYDTLRHFEQNLGWLIEGNENQIILFKQNKRVKPEELRVFMQNSLGAVSVFGITKSDFA